MCLSQQYWSCYITRTIQIYLNEYTSFPSKSDYRKPVTVIIIVLNLFLAEEHKIYSIFPTSCWMYIINNTRSEYKGTFSFWILSGITISILICRFKSTFLRRNIYFVFLSWWETLDESKKRWNCTVKLLYVFR